MYVALEELRICIFLKRNELTVVNQRQVEVLLWNKK